MLTYVLFIHSLLHIVAFRSVSNRTYQEGSAGFVKNVFTFGAPHISNPPLTDRGGGCFPGFRITAFKRTRDVFQGEFLNEEDIVPTLLVPSKYRHPNIQTLAIRDEEDGFHVKWRCGNNPLRITEPTVALHPKEVYISAMKRLNGGYSRAKVASSIGLVNSYESNKDKVQERVSEQGWNRVASAFGGEDVMHLMQEKSSKRCLLTFEGSDWVSDFLADLKVKRVRYCGLSEFVHLGFRQELERITTTPDFQNKIRPNLGKCSEVDVTGHSLGGATAHLFAACIASQNAGEEDYDRISWKTSSPSMIPIIE